VRPEQATEFGRKTSKNEYTPKPTLLFMRSVKKANNQLGSGLGVLGPFPECLRVSGLG
jgi:hypothetical protein